MTNAKKTRTYYTLATREYEGADWSPQFGDYSRGVVEAEKEDYLEQGYEKKDLKIIQTGDTQQQIDDEIAVLNRK